MYIYIYHLVSPFLFSHMHMHLSIYIFIYLFIYTKIHTYVEIHECHVPSLVLHILSSISAIERLLFHRPRSKQVTWGKIMGLHLRVDVASLPHPYYAPWCWYIYLHNWQLGDFVRVNDGKCWSIFQHHGAFGTANWPPRVIIEIWSFSPTYPIGSIKSTDDLDKFMSTPD